MFLLKEKKTLSVITEHKTTTSNWRVKWGRLSKDSMFELRLEEEFPQWVCETVQSEPAAPAKSQEYAKDNWGIPHIPLRLTDVSSLDKLVNKVLLTRTGAKMVNLIWGITSWGKSSAVLGPARTSSPKSAFNDVKIVAWKRS